MTAFVALGCAAVLWLLCPRSMRRHRNAPLLLVLLLLVSTLYCIVATKGSGDFAAGEYGGAAYDSLADNLLHLKPLVDREAIGIEAYIVDGKTVMYFGPLPAFLRIPANWLFPGMRGCWSRLSTLLAGLLCVAGFLRLLAPYISNVRVQSFWLFALIPAFSFGTVLFHLIARAQIYHEAIAWGLCGSIWGLTFLLGQPRYYSSFRGLAGLSVAAGAALLSRPTFGAPFYVILALYAVTYTIGFARRPGVNVRAVWLCLLPALVILLFQLWYNNERFKSPFCFKNESRKWDARSGADPGNLLSGFRMSAYEYGPGAVTEAFRNYFTFTTRVFSATAPFISFTTPEGSSSLVSLNQGKKFLPLWISSPWLLLGATLGLCLLLAGKGGCGIPLLFVPFALQVWTMLHFAYIDHRYAAEFIPALILLFVVFLRRVPAALRDSRLARCAFFILACFSIYATVVSSLWDPYYC